MLEIERKFLVTSDGYLAQADRYEDMKQGFLSVDPERTVRVRISGGRGKITVKGASSSDGTTRREWERDISKEDAEGLLKMCLPGVISKRRYFVPVASFIFEVDVFAGDNQGLVVAEVELESAEQQFAKPEWLGEEVTGDAKYYNSQLSKKPYNQWLDTSFL